jgi:signal transduction histidine kinase
MRALIHSLLLLAGFAGSVRISAQPLPPRLSPYVADVIASATQFMNASLFDSAQVRITEAFLQSDVRISSYDLYFLHCYEAEIMYYNALFEQGLSSAMRGVEMAVSTGDPILEGNAENLAGLLMMGMNRFQEAIPRFRKAAQRIPESHDNPYLTYRYQALANLGECYARLGKADSAMIHSEASLRLAGAIGKERGIALAHWNIAEAWLLRSEPDSAVRHGLEGYRLVSATPHRDVVQTMAASLMKSYAMRGENEKAREWLRKGITEIEHPQNTNFSRILFLEEAVSLAIALEDTRLALDLLQKLHRLRQETSTRQQEQRLAILKEYYLKNQRLILAQEQAEAQRKELELRTTLMASLAVLVLALAVLLYIIRMNARQKRQIQELQHEEALRETRRVMELESLRNQMAAVQEERNRIASDLHDDMGAALSSIRIYSEAAQKQYPLQPEESLRLMSRIQQGSTDMMERMSDIIWSIHPDHDTADSLVLRMKTFASELLGPMDIAMRFETSAEVGELLPSMIGRRNLYLFFKEAVHNLAKYSGCTDAWCIIRISGDDFFMEVGDNGSGFDPDRQKAGQGMKSMVRRAEALGGTVRITSADGLGTLVELRAALTNIRDSRKSA